mmetsp:Transcript_29940/g.26499  ORF Transcript_29940/g.26499 Transcript_29940/m.26499 type:complete len:107 (-) Transcript_29940:687-1007(-)
MKALQKFPYQSQTTAVNQTYDPRRVYQSSFKKVDRSNSLRIKGELSTVHALNGQLAQLKTQKSLYHQELQKCLISTQRVINYVRKDDDQENSHPNSALTLVSHDLE